MPNPANNSNAVKPSPALKKTASTAPVGGGTAGGSGTAGRSGATAKRNAAVGSGAPVGGGTAGGSAGQSSNPIQRRTTGQSGTPGQNGNQVKSETPVLKFEDVEKKAAKAFFALKAKSKKEYNNKTECEKVKCKRSNGQWGGRFLQEREHIEHQALFKLAQEAPKGAHLHIHLNACLEPKVLLELAASDELKHNMYISVDLQDPEKVEHLVAVRKAEKTKKDKEEELAKKNGKPVPPATPPTHDCPEPLTDANIDKAKFQFHFLKHNWRKTCSVFDPKYCGRIGPTEKPDDEAYHVMKFTDFLRDFHTKIRHPPKPNEPKEKGYQGPLPKLCMDWLIHKLVFQENEVRFTEVEKETANKTEPAAIARQWALFNTRTQMMKGLFMAEFAYRKYLRGLFSSFDKDKIQYAELRPNFMAANSVIHTSKSYRKPIKKNDKETGEFEYDPKEMMGNREIMRMIIDEFEDWQGKHPEATFKSMKVIMCTPRSPGYPIRFIRATVQECFKMKQEDDFKPWIAGFDFVGPEHEGRMLSDLADDFATWVPEAKRIGLKWILHCGESYYDKDVRDKEGKVKEGNLKFALNHLEPHRLAHGYAIKKANLSAQHMKQLQDCCIETCPSSNEILGLAYNAKYAAVHWLKSKEIPCSVSCDNPTLFNSTLSHEFYQVTVGNDKFGLMEWKELMMDSIEHSVWNGKDDKVKAMVLAEWQAQYKKFVYMIKDKYSYLLEETS
ncbi:hypothetical protein SLS63_004218 [Diaporthe eres]|uniref:Adenosine deaminase domain-containing protein n=1 Tax=Diaporthe eres TaxID=83184 RepID=A0ABR1PEB4_DIAER